MLETSNDDDLTQAIKDLTQATLKLTTLIEKQQIEKKFVPLRLAATELGVGCDWIRSQIRKGVYRHSVHFINTSTGDRPNYLVNISRIRKELQTLPEKRA